MRLILTLLFFCNLVFSQSGPVAYYPFDGDILDYSGNNNNGTVSGNTLFTADKNGESNKAFYFDGGTEIKGNDQGTNLPFYDSPRTIVCWIKFLSGGSSDIGIYHYGTTGDAKDFHFYRSHTTMGVGNGYAQGSIGATTQIVNGQWYLAAGVYEGTGTNLLKIYINGSLDHSGVIDRTPNTTPLKWTIGGFLGYGGGLNAYVDELKIYDRALSESEMLNLLPVELTFFDSRILDDKVILNWETATEINNYGFELERASTLPTKKWEPIGFVEGYGNSNSPKKYEFIDRNPLEGIMHYRLKQIDTDGNYEYYDTILEVNFVLVSVEEITLPAEYAVHQNFPNPFNPTTNISYNLPEESHVKIDIFNIQGRKIKALVDKLQTSGSYNIQFDGSGIPGGVYLYSFKTDRYFEVRKMIMLK